MKRTGMTGVLLGMGVAGVLLVTGCSQATTEATASSKEDVKGAQPVVINGENFAQEVEQAEGLVVVDFWATWCPPCRAIAPTLKELAVEYEGKVKIAKVDVDQHGDLAQRFNISSIPNLIMFKDGKPIDNKLGAYKKADYVAWFNENL